MRLPFDEMAHEELVAELPMLEKMPTHERLKLAKKRRSQQMKRWYQFEKQMEKEKKRKSSTTNSLLPNKRSSKPQVIPPQKSGRNVIFVNNIILLEAASRNDIEEVHSLLMMGVSPDVTNEDGLTALHQCCIDDNENMTRLLIDFSANVNAQDSELWTPLHAAATCGHVHLCKYLIEKGADLLAVNADGNMPYDICEDEVTLDYIESEMAKRGVTQELIDETRLSNERLMLEDLKKLAQQGKDLNFKDRNGVSPLHIAAANGYIQAAEFLLLQNVSLDVQDNDSWQPLHAAACWGQPAIIEILVKHGADIDAKTRNGEGVLDICEDMELRQQILDLKDEIANNKINIKHSLTRTRSQNTRSVIHGSTGSLYSSTASLSDRNTSRRDKILALASVRRSSMREKNLISWKEAREEAKLRSSMTEDEEDNTTSNSETATTTTNMLTTTTLTTNNMSTTSTSDSSQGKMPEQISNVDVKPEAVVNVDDVTVAFKVDPVTTVDSTTDSLKESEKKVDRVDADVMSSEEPPLNKTPSLSSLENKESNKTPSRSPSFTLKDRRGSMEVHVSSGSTNANSGTLSDLKRHRSASMQRTRSLEKSETESCKSSSNSINSSNGTTPLIHLDNNNKNAQTNAVVPTPYFIPPSPAYGDPPLRKFKAHNTEIVGGDSTKQSCCTIL
ncbi:uncharacterized protein LOC141902560 isoform X2 [Tubulanus polymorphus]|uniref:uncharacterized protein LOC141902560 isoform X2 n=1 Tax=Tubulanus polymorphus TaxID=672921 RepID=UPI003DA698BE